MQFGNHAHPLHTGLMNGSNQVIPPTTEIAPQRPHLITHWQWKSPHGLFIHSASRPRPSLCWLTGNGCLRHPHGCTDTHWISCSISTGQQIASSYLAARLNQYHEREYTWMTFLPCQLFIFIYFSLSVHLPHEKQVGPSVTEHLEHLYNLIYCHSLSQGALKVMLHNVISILLKQQEKSLGE